MNPPSALFTITFLTSHQTSSPHRTIPITSHASIESISIVMNGVFIYKTKAFHSHMHSQTLSFLCVGVSPKCIIYIMCHILRSILSSTHGTSFLLDTLAIHRVLDDIACRCTSHCTLSFHQSFIITCRGYHTSIAITLSSMITHHKMMLLTTSPAHITSYTPLRWYHLIKPEQHALVSLSSSSVLHVPYSRTNYFVLR